MAIPQPHKLGVGMPMCMPHRAFKDYTHSPIRTSFFHPLPSHLIHYLNQDLTLKKRCRDGAMCAALCGVHIGIPTPSLCGFWHGHSYIFCENVFYTCLCFFVILKVVLLETLFTL